MILEAIPETVVILGFVVAAMILLVAIVAAIALTLRRRPGTRIQSVDQQVAARRNERVRLVSMNSEERK